MSENRT